MYFGRFISLFLRFPVSFLTSADHIYSMFHEYIYAYDFLNWFFLNRFIWNFIYILMKLSKNFVWKLHNTGVYRNKKAETQITSVEIKYIFCRWGGGGGNFLLILLFPCEQIECTFHYFSHFQDQIFPLKLLNEWFSPEKAIWNYLIDSSTLL